MNERFYDVSDESLKGLEYRYLELSEAARDVYNHWLGELAVVRAEIDDRDQLNSLVVNNE